MPARPRRGLWSLAHVKISVLTRGSGRANRIAGRWKSQTSREHQAHDHYFKRAGDPPPHTISPPAGAGTPRTATPVRGVIAGKRFISYLAVAALDVYLPRWCRCYLIVGTRWSADEYRSKHGYAEEETAGGGGAGGGGGELKVIESSRFPLRCCFIFGS